MFGGKANLLFVDFAQGGFLLIYFLDGVLWINGERLFDLIWGICYGAENFLGGFVGGVGLPFGVDHL
jgi:prepilin-type processing-associated H-X9-DG protein